LAKSIHHTAPCYAVFSTFQFQDSGYCFKVAAEKLHEENLDLVIAGDIILELGLKILVLNIHE
jgi:hypothetical protein